MVLTSQTPRPMNRYRFMSRRRRARRGPTLFIVAALAVTAGVLWLVYGWPTGAGTDQNSGTGPAPVVEDQLARGDAIVGGPATPTGAAGAPSAGNRPAASAAGNDRRSEAVPVEPHAITMGEQPSSTARDTVNAIASIVSNVTQPAEPVQAADPAEVVRGPSPAPPKTATGRTSDDLARGLALAASDPVQARRVLTPIVADRSRPLVERDQAREALGEINAVLVFSPRILPGDAFSEVYVVQSGDSLVRIAQERHLETDWRFLKRINGIADERRLREGQRLKLVVGTFHAVVSKSEYRMDIYLGEGRERVLVASFPVGLGEYNSTPTGAFQVRPRSKLVNPQWVNPRTGQAFAADDPKNPIGERWIGLIGTEPSNKDIEGYGIHGTIDPGSIGQQASMGCVRMNAADVEVVYELLTEPNSTIEIVP